MSFNTDDTICAIATAAGGAIRGIIRVSGPAAVAIAARLFEALDRRPIDTIRYATALPGRLRIDVDASPRFLPCDLFLWPTSRSYTREPVAELHTIGSPPLLGSLVTAACHAGARLAEPGEFTLRAFLSGRLDLTQAEAVLGVIDARGDEDFDTALVQLAGGLAGPLHQLRSELLQLLAELEAGLDFVEEDIEFISATELQKRLESGEHILEGVAEQMAARYVVSDLMQVVLTGPPNVGKSSLFNSMVERFGCNAQSESAKPAPALVSSQRGTTRDYLAAAISVNGVQCELIDTAGIDDFSEPRSEKTSLPASSIDIGAQTLATERRKGATIRVCCVEAQAEVNDFSLTDFESRVGLAECDVIVLTKSDTLPHNILRHEQSQRMPVVLTSSRTGQGLEELSAAFYKLLTCDNSAQHGQVVSATADRCRQSVRLAEKSLKRAIELVLCRGGNELVAVELCAALDQLGSVVGAVYTDDLLDRIFGTFCIGK